MVRELCCIPQYDSLLITYILLSFYDTNNDNIEDTDTAIAPADNVFSPDTLPPALLSLIANPNMTAPNSIPKAPTRLAQLPIKSIIDLNSNSADVAV